MSRNKPAKHHGKKNFQHKKQTPRTWWLLGLVVVAVVAGLVIVNLLKNPGSGGSSTSITPQQAHEKYTQGVFILDVREQVEYDAYHIPGSVLIPLGDLERRVGELPQDREIVVVCATGNRSQEGRRILVNYGFANVLNMSGGVSAWMSLGYDVEE